MPPKAKITREMILNTVLGITRESGFEAVNARSIAGRLRCSTRPIFTCYENMEELKAEFLAFAYEYYERYVAEFRDAAAAAPALILPLSYIEFAQEEPLLFKLLFVDDMDLKMTEAKDFYREIGNENRARAFSQAVGIEPERGKAVFLDLFLYAHGIAALAASKKFAPDRSGVEKMAANLLAALLKQENVDGETQGQEMRRDG